MLFLKKFKDYPGGKIIMQNTAVQPTRLTQFELSKQLIQSKFFSKVKLSPSARLVLIVLCSHYPNIYPSIKTIQEEAGINSKQSVITALKELSKHGLILYETKKSNNYQFTGLFFNLLDVQKLETNKQSNKKINKPFKNLKKFESPQEGRSGFEQKGQLTDQIKLPKYYHNTQITGINYPKWKKPENIEPANPKENKEWMALKDILKSKNRHGCMRIN